MRWDLNGSSPFSRKKRLLDFFFFSFHHSVHEVEENEGIAVCLGVIHLLPASQFERQEDDVEVPT
jgi:hypothetical protein